MRFTEDYVRYNITIWVKKGNHSDTHQCLLIFLCSLFSYEEQGKDKMGCPLCNLSG